jgi:hypothetical protein
LQFQPSVFDSPLLVGRCPDQVNISMVLLGLPSRDPVRSRAGTLSSVRRRFKGGGMFVPLTGLFEQVCSEHDARNTDALRSLKRRFSDAVYRHVQADACAALTT